MEDSEWIIGTRPSKEHDRFLARVNNNEFAGVDLNQVFSRKSTPLGKQMERISYIQEERQNNGQELQYKAMVQAYKDGAADIVEAI